MNPELVRFDLVPLAILGAVGTYAARALPLLVPGIDRLPPLLLEYLRLIGPAVLGAIAAAAVFVSKSASGPVLHVGPEAVAVIAGSIVGRWRGSLLLGMATSVVVVQLLRATIAG
jgi:branched-subunit amino acid transport protein